MKRLGAVFVAAVFGLIVTWASGYVGSRIDWPVSKNPARGCYEIDHCDVPWWFIAMTLVWFLGPSVAYGVTAFIGTGKQWSSARWAGAFSLLVLLTAGLYFTWYAYRAFW